MIIQAVRNKGPTWVTTMQDHLQMAGSIARALKPLSNWIADSYEIFIDATAHHDDGWARFDAQMGQNPATGLPYGLFETPADVLLQVRLNSVYLAQKRSHYSNLLISMHILGLHTGRFGLDEPSGFLNQLSPEIRAQFNTFLAKETTRQKQLIQQLSTDPKRKSWVKRRSLFAHYYAMQFCDLLSLYFLTQEATLRGVMHFPKIRSNELHVTVKPLDNRHYQLHPYPFQEHPLEISWQSRRMAPQPLGSDVAAVLASLPLEKNTVSVNAG